MGCVPSCFSKTKILKVSYQSLGVYAKIALTGISSKGNVRSLAPVVSKAICRDVEPRQVIQML